MSLRRHSSGSWALDVLGLAIVACFGVAVAMLIAHWALS